MRNGWLIRGLGLSACLFSSMLTGCLDRPGARPASPSTQTGATSQARKREPIYFIKGDASLSPGALAKLRNWVKAWGSAGTWTLECPSEPGMTYDLLQRRVLALRTELAKLGVAAVETRLVPMEPPGPYDPVYVVKETP